MKICKFASTVSILREALPVKLVPKYSEHRVIVRGQLSLELVVY